MTRAGDWVVFVPLSTGSCAGAAALGNGVTHGGPVSAFPFLVTVSLSATTPVYALCLAHRPFASFTPVDSEFSYHPH
eukprot:6809141-Prymnesium_polylepis.1